MTREQFEEWLQSNGALLKKSTTRDTDILLVGVDPGENKILKAQKYGIPQIHVIMFQALGFMEDRGPYMLEGIDQGIISRLTAHMAIVAEEMYAHAYASKEPESGLAFTAAAAAIEIVLRAAWGDPKERHHRERAPDK
jgi:hypothetical protein